MNFKRLCIIPFVICLLLFPGAAAAAEVLQLTDTPELDGFPFWSPDGERIAYTSFDPVTGDMTIRVMAADGTAGTDLTPAGSRDFFVTNPWSPDGKEILFISDRSGSYDLWVMNADGTGPVQVTNGTNVVPWLHGPRGCEAEWSPDGRMIAYTSCLFGGADIREATADEHGGRASMNINFSEIRKEADIWVINPDGSGGRGLTSSGDALMPRWHPGGDRIAYLSRASGTAVVWVMNLDGSGELQVTPDGEDVLQFSWSPDGRKILYAVQTYDPISDNVSFGVRIVNADGSSLRHLTSGNVDTAPVWSPDGEKIAFYSQSRPPSSIWVMDTGGSDLQPLAPGYLTFRMHRWSPDGQKIAVSDGNDIFVAVPDSPAAATPGFGIISAVAAFSIGALAIRAGRQLWRIRTPRRDGDMSSMTKTRGSL
ncbi:peptidase S9 [Methanoculleus sp. UBA303]|jgi:TolB protein|uniref:peptidase S9 n=1 Tax=Methanoculleus sp. UBA303 TaxID=1915497 RepID=UPI0025EC8DC8|nr:peptidase S9 [Methanoculleus sp. UBA303]